MDKFVNKECNSNVGINLVLNSNEAKRILELENAFKAIDDISFFTIKKFSLNKTTYEIIYNTDPKKLKKQFLVNGFLIDNQEGYWLIK